MRLRDIRVGEAYAVRLPGASYGSDEWNTLERIAEHAERTNGQWFGVMNRSVARLVVEEVGVPWKGRPHGVRGITQQDIPRVKDRPDEWTVVFERDEDGRIVMDARDAEIVVRFSAVLGPWEEWVRPQREEYERQRAVWEAGAPERQRRHREAAEARRNSPDPAVRERQRVVDQRNREAEQKALDYFNRELFDLLDQEGR